MLTMNFIPCLTHRAVPALLLASVLVHPVTARAHVYATAVKLNGASASVTSPQGRSLAISYILNEAATDGVTVEILAGTNVVRSLTFASGQGGALRGVNTVAWDGRDQGGALAPEGLYSVRLTAASAGHSGWTMISTDHRTNNYVYRGTGIAVNQNPNSPFYGRVYVVNADSGPNAGLPGAKPGENNGVLQFNADGSLPDEGALGMVQGWTGFEESPWRVQVSGDDRVFVSDLFYSGEVLSWEASFTEASRREVLRAGNVASGTRLSGFSLVVSGTNRWLYAADSAQPSAGVVRYPMDEAGQAPAGFTGLTVVGVTNAESALNVAPYDVAADRGGNVYAIQYVFAAGDPSPRLLKFSLPADGSAGAFPVLEPEWAVGQGDDTLGRASAVAVDPMGRYVAVATRGITGPEFEWINGCTQIFDAESGVLVTNLDLGVEIAGELTHQDTAVTWDAVGNVYFIDDYVQLWRTFSPPGPNASTTLAPYTIQIIPAVNEEPPRIGGITVGATTVTITFMATVGTPASTFQVLGAATANGPYNPVLGATVVPGATPGVYVATLPIGGAMAFYRILEGEAPPVGENPVLQGITLNGNTVSILFTASASDLPASFTLMSSAVPTGNFVPAAGAAITAGSVPGEFRATVPASGLMQFYRVRK